MEQGHVLGNDRDRGPQALLSDPCDILPGQQNAPALHVVETLQQNEQCGFAAA